MGFSLTGTHVIFFIASIIVAGMVSGIFIAVTLNITGSLSEKGGRVQEQLDTEFSIINDPEHIKKQGDSYLFYIKNVGGKKLDTTNQTFQVFLDGEIISVTNYSFADNSLPVSGVTTLYVKTTLETGDYTLRVVGPLAIDDKFIFTIT